MNFYLTRMTTFLFVFASMFSTFAISSQQQSLNFYIEHAINTNPDAQASFHDFKSATFDVDNAKAGYLPKVDLYGKSDFVDRNYGLERSYASHIAEISLSQMLYDGFETKAKVQQSQKIRKVRFFELMSVIESIALQTATAYFDVLLQRELLVLADNNLISHVDVFKQIEEGVLAGVTRGADLEQISGRLSLSESNVLTEQANLHDVTARFLRLTGLLPSKQLDPVTKPSMIELESFQDFLLSAYANNPALKASIYNIEAQQLLTRSAQSNYHPKVDLVASYGTQSRDEQSLNNTITEGRIGLQVSLNLFRGGADKANISAALENVNVAKDLRDKSCRDVRQTVQIAFNDINNLERQIVSLNAHRISSDRVNTAYFDQFNIGQRTLLDLLDSENEFYESSRAYVAASYTLQKGYFLLLNGLGRLTESLGLQRQDLSSNKFSSDATDYNAEFICPPDTKGKIQYFDDILQRDTDQDGVIDLWDDCPDSKMTDNVNINDFGCVEKMEFIDPFEEELTPVINLSKPATPKNPNDEMLFEENVKVLKSITLDIPFAANSSQIIGSYKDDLAAIITLLLEQPNTKVIIHGHASLEGTESYNQNLSEQRAQQAAIFLAKQGNIEKSRITAVGYGETRPRVNANDDESDALNRRIEVYVVNINDKNNQ